jgi:hypothetical protein
MWKTETPNVELRVFWIVGRFAGSTFSTRCAWFCGAADAAEFFHYSTLTLTLRCRPHRRIRLFSAALAKKSDFVMLPFPLPTTADSDAAVGFFLVEFLISFFAKQLNRDCSCSFFLCHFQSIGKLILLVGRHSIQLEKRIFSLKTFAANTTWKGLSPVLSQEGRPWISCKH